MPTDITDQIRALALTIPPGETFDSGPLAGASKYNAIMYTIEVVNLVLHPKPSIQPTELEPGYCSLCGLDHRPQVDEYPVGSKAKLVLDVPEEDDNPISRGTIMEVTHHTNDGRAIWRARKHGPGHTFHHPAFWLEKI